MTAVLASLEPRGWWKVTRFLRADKNIDGLLHNRNVYSSGIHRSRRSAWGNVFVSSAWSTNMEQDQFLCVSTRTSSDDCQETETGTVRACRTPRHPLQNHPSRHLGVWATPWSAGEMLDGQHQEWTSLLMSKLLTTASCRKDWQRISAESSLMSSWRPNRSKDCTELNWRQMLIK